MRYRRACGLLIVAAVAACSSGQRQAVAASPARSGTVLSAASVAPAAGGCSAAPVISPLPAWARSGFHPPDPAMPHVLGKQGNIVAILWARRDALHSPPLANRANKILWVSRLALGPGAPLTIRAVLNGTGRTAERVISYGPGPSYVNLPAAGCWTLNLSWSGHRDRVELCYVAS